MAILEEKTKSTKAGLAVTLRSAKHEDAAELLEVLRANIASSGHLLTQADEFDFKADQQEQRIKSFSERPTDLWIVALVDEKIVGVLDFRSGVRRRNSHQGDFGISILPRFRGQGIGRVMIATLLEWAKAHPIVEQVRLKVHDKNLGATQLYSSLGFREEGREIKDVKISEGNYDDVISMVTYV